MENVSEKKSAWQTLREYVILIGTSLLLVFIVRTFIAQPFVVNGSSMEPTFHSNEYLVVDQLSYTFGEPQRGDIIIFKYPLIPSRFFIKRVIALPGETIRISGNQVEIQPFDSDEFFTLEEPYIEFAKESILEITLELDEYFVMGDNRMSSLDSRSWGPLKESFIVGKAFLRLYPVSKIDFLPGNY